MARDGGVRQPLPKNISRRYLGNVADEDLKFNCHTKAAVAKENQKLGITKRANTRRSPANVTKLYKILVR